MTRSSLTCKGWRWGLGCLVTEEATASLPSGSATASTSSLLLLEQAPTWLLEAASQLMGGLRSLLHHLRLQICYGQRALQKGRAQLPGQTWPDCTACASELPLAACCTMHHQNRFEQMCHQVRGLAK